MQKKPSALKLILFFLVILGIASCNRKMVYNEYQSMPQAQWHKDSIVEFVIPAMDTVQSNNVYVTLRNDKDYEFSNLFLIVGMRFPNNYQVVDTLEYEMTTPEGRFLGTGMSDVKENKLEYKTSVRFVQEGEYHLTVQHAMRKSRDIEGLDYLKGITDVGVQIEKSN